MPICLATLWHIILFLWNPTERSFFLVSSFNLYKSQVQQKILLFSFGKILRNVCTDQICCTRWKFKKPIRIASFFAEEPFPAIQTIRIVYAALCHRIRIEWTKKDSNNIEQRKNILLSFNYGHFNSHSLYWRNTNEWPFHFTCDDIHRTNFI